MVDDEREGALACVGNSDVEPAELGGEIGQGSHRGFVGDVAVSGDHPVAMLGGQCGQAGCVDVAGDDLRPVGNEAIGDGAADACGGTGDECGLALQGGSHAPRR